MPRLAYLLGASHSGSTLLAMLLGAQPGACTAGELKATSLGDANAYRCSCHEPIVKCPFWNQIKSAMKRRGIHDFDITRSGTSIEGVPSRYLRHLLTPLYRKGVLEHARDFALSLSPQWRSALRECQARNLALINSLCEVTGSKVVIDSSKSALRLKYLLAIPSLEIRVIHLIRDGRAVSLTYTDEWNFADAANPAHRGGGSGWQRAPSRRTMEDATREWMRSNESAEAILSTLSRGHWKQIRYEDLCAAPEASLREINEFLGIDPDQTHLNYRSVPQHVIGNGMRMDSISEIRLDDRWRSNLDAHNLQVFKKIAGAMNRRYGYD